MSARAPKDTDFFVTLPDVGDFIFARRTLGDAMKIRGRYLRLLGESGAGDTEEPDPELSGYANVIATIAVLLVKAPSAQWADPLAIDLVGNPQALDQIVSLYTLLSEAEDSFRHQAAGPSAA